MTLSLSPRIHKPRAAGVAAAAAAGVAAAAAATNVFFSLLSA